MQFQRLLLSVLSALTAVVITSTTSFGGTELRMRNGDRLTGDLLRRENGKIHFRSPILGEIVVPQSEAVLVEVPDTPVESLVGLPPSESQTAQVTAAGHPLPQPSVVAGAPATSRGTAPKAAPWRGKIELGYQQQSGRRDTINATLRAEAERARGPDTLKASGRILYGESNHKVSSERYDASFRWRHQFNKRMFGQSLTSYNRDSVKDIELNLEQNAGIGYRILNRPRHLVNIGLGLTGQQREADGVKDEPIALGEVFQDYTYKFNGRLSFLQETNAVYSNKSVINNGVDVSNYRIRFNSALQGKVTNRVSLNLRYEYEWDNTAPNMDEKRDQRITSSIGYAL